MENDKLDQIWNDQDLDLSIAKPHDIIRKANNQRRSQYITITILIITVLVLLVFSFYFARQWNDFTLGMTLMISSLVFRIVLEFISIYRKEGELIALDSTAFRAYLRKHYRARLRINYIITPICFAIYVMGFLKLLPYFKQELSKGFYDYILISGIVTLIVLIGIITKSVRKEIRFLRQLNRQQFDF